MNELRAHVTIPDDVRDLFQWLQKYDPRFEGSAAGVAAYLIRVGAQHVYEAGLGQATPLDDEVAEDLAKRSEAALRASHDR